MSQMMLAFDPPAVCVDTSIAAARSMRPHVGRLQARVLSEIRLAGDRGRTDCELVEVLQLRESTIRARRVELRDQGFICDSGLRRPTGSGRLAIAWRVAQS